MAGSDFAYKSAALKPVLERHAERLTVTADSTEGYSVSTRTPSPFPQHAGEPLFFGAVRVGKAYVGFHLMPIYMCPELSGKITPALKKRMQGKSCFNFKTPPDSALLAELTSLTDAAVDLWSSKKWL